MSISPRLESAPARCAPAKRSRAGAATRSGTEPGPALLPSQEFVAREVFFKPASGDRPQPKETSESSWAARLLEPSSDTLPGVRKRLGLGLAGLLALGVVPRLALLTAEAQPSETPVSEWLLCGMALPLAATLTLTVPLPGLVILLGVRDERLAPGHLVYGISRALFRFGLLALGVTPILSLYALTGARAHAIAAWTALSYFLTGAMILWLFERDLFRCLKQKASLSTLTILGWGAFVTMLGLYFYVKFAGVA